MPIRSRSKSRLPKAILAGLAAAVLPAIASAAPAQCIPGAKVTDDLGLSGTVIGGDNTLCLVRYHDGRTQGWVPRTRLRAAAPSGSGEPAADADSPGVTVLRPAIINSLQYKADALGHFTIPAIVNGAPIKFLLDTGATLVALTPADAAAAGIPGDDLKFDQTVQTGNGPTKAAPTKLRNFRVDQLQLDNVDAVVIEKLKQSVLGMSFLRRLKDFSIRDGTLTMEW